MIENRWTRSIPSLRLGVENRRAEPQRTFPTHVTLAVVLQVREGGLCVLLWQRARPPFSGPGRSRAAISRPGDTLERLDPRPARRQGRRGRAVVARAARDRSPTPAGIRASGSSPPPIWASSRSGSTPHSRRTPRGTRSTSCPRSPSTTRRSCSPAASDCGPSCPTRTSASRSRPSASPISELTAIYTAALGYPVDPTNLRRVLERRGLLEATGERRTPGREGGRPAAVYRFASRDLEVTDPFAVLRPPTPVALEAGRSPAPARSGSARRR